MSIVICTQPGRSVLLENPITYVVPTVVKFIETESGMVGATGWEWGKRGSYHLVGIEIQFCKLEILEMDGGYDYITK